MRSNKFLVLSVAAIGLAPMAAFASTAAATTAIAAAATPIAAIGSAVLVVLVGIKVLKWVRRAF